MNSDFSNFLDSVSNIADLDLRRKVISVLKTRLADRHMGDHGAYVDALEKNYDGLKSLTDKFGWPSVEKLKGQGVSQEDAAAIEVSAFLCVQHLDANIVPRLLANNPSLSPNDMNDRWKDMLEADKVVERQAEMLSLMKKDGASPELVCYLTDRNLRNKDENQEFGTQYYPPPIEYQGKIDLDGWAVGFETMGADENLRSMLIEKRKNAGLSEESIAAIDKCGPLQFLSQDMLGFLAGSKVDLRDDGKGMENVCDNLSEIERHDTLSKYNCSANKSGEMER